jgi:hypothetical protein
MLKNGIIMECQKKNRMLELGHKQTHNLTTIITTITAK